MRVVIIGGGFAGLAAARGLGRSAVTVTLIDRSNHHLFQPLLYQVAMAGLAPSDIAVPLRALIANQPNADVLLGDVQGVDVTARTVAVTGPDGRARTLPYDRLIVAAGASHGYFGRDDWEPFAPGLKTLGDALEIRRRVLSAFERAEWASDDEERRALLTFVVIGAGPTGVELAGSLIEIARTTLRHNFRHFDPSKTRVVLLEGSDHVLTAYHPTLRARALEQLVSLGVEVQLGARVTDIDADGVSIGDQRISSRTVLWAAGVRGAPLAASLGAPLDRAGRVIVGPDGALPGHPEVFVVGDLAAMTDANGRAVPGVAPAATQMGDFVAACIDADLAGQPRGTFRYHDKGSMATIGRSRAIVEIGRLRLSGLFAWWLWVFVHIAFLIAFRNRLLVLTKWAWAWLRYDRAARLIWRRSAAEPAA